MPLRLRAIAVRILILMVLVAFFSVKGIKASTLVLPNGDKLTGKVIETKAGKLYFYANALQTTVSVDASSVQVIDPAGEPKPNSAQPSVATKAVAQVSKAPKTPHPPAWKGKLEVGYSQQTAAGLHAANLSVGAEEAKIQDKNDYMAKAHIFYSSSAQIPIIDQKDASFRWRHDLSPKLFSQSETSFNQDKIQLINHQYEENVGIGFKVHDDSTKTMNLVMGLTGEDLSATGIQSGLSYLGRVSEDFVYKFNSHIKFTQDASVEYSPLMQNRNGLVPSLIEQVNTNIAEYNYKIHSTIESKLTKTLTFNVHFEYEYNNATLDPLARTEQKFISALSYGF